MKPSARPLTLAVAVAALISGGALVWLTRELMASPRTVGSRPSLLELLEEVRQAPPRRRSVPRQPPPPPPKRAWSSPLQQACPAVDPSLQNRLIADLSRLDSLTRRVEIHPTNFGSRYREDAFGNPVDPTPRLIVLHETVYGIGSAISTFRTPHPRDEDQVSYHTLISEQGDVVSVLDPSLRAFGAGNSAFNGEWVITNPEVGGSVNNFALHLSLETPIDGEDADLAHSGYSEAQYDALALVIGDWMQRFNIPASQITTHRHIDLGGARADPRSFDWSKLNERLAALGLVC
jgi:hypothetical protein